MKKIHLTTITCLSLLTLSAQAATVGSHSSVCPFTDNFYIDGANIQQLTSSGNVAVQQKSSTKFITTCANNQSADSGNIYLTVNNSSKGSCNLTLKDGPYEMNPSVTSVNCGDKLQFSGVSHDYGSYDYTLKFK